MQLQCTCSPKVLSQLLLSDRVWQIPHKQDRNLDELGAGLSSDADFRFHKEACGLTTFAGFGVVLWSRLAVTVLCDKFGLCVQRTVCYFLGLKNI